MATISITIPDTIIDALCADDSFNYDGRKLDGESKANFIKRVVCVEYIANLYQFVERDTVINAHIW